MSDPLVPQNLLTQLARFDGAEVFDTLLEGEDGLRIERIVSWGAASPEQGWYDQETAEWLVVLEGEAELEFADGARQMLVRGDSLYLAPHRLHRVLQTSSPCIWLTVHFRPRRNGDGVRVIR